ncbi:hypothetical protein LOK49_LG15G01984 [Camellia lanceoleosa]|uniref:Uncharacterized protein n=1 Tax=Camellia lanceoleosa TaxID=1840588 RepID=A0ACC0F3F3_9ERIC|nr:hypothetical protein LOK49_LG15G01984 [Camellia lanceoleosa]
MQVEKLIKELPSMLADLSNGDLNSAEKDQLSNGISFQHTANGTNPREAQSMLLERIASEMNRLKFYITHAQEELRPYFSLPVVIDGIPIAYFYFDPYSRPLEKHGGAWMDIVAGWSRILCEGTSSRLPICHVVCNQTPPVGDKPSLMTIRECSKKSHSKSISSLLSKLISSVFRSNKKVVLSILELSIIELQLPSFFNNFDPRAAAANFPSGAQAYLAGLTFALAVSPCSTPVLATLLGYVAASKSLLSFRKFSAWINPMSGAFLLGGGIYTLLDRLFPVTMA